MTRDAAHRAKNRGRPGHRPPDSVLSTSASGRGKKTDERATLSIQECEAGLTLSLFPELLVGNNLCEYTVTKPLVCGANRHVYETTRLHACGIPRFLG